MKNKEKYKLMSEYIGDNLLNNLLMQKWSDY